MPSSISTSQTTIGNLLRQAVLYVVPENQRDYSWTDDEIEQLWTDLCDAMSASRPEHFMGAIVVNDANPAQQEIIDGQQRLATVSVLIAVLRAKAEGLQDKDRAAELQRLLGDRNLKTLVTNPKLRLNDANDQHYRHFIVESCPLDQVQAEIRNPRTRKTNILLLNSFVQLAKRVDELIAKGQSFPDVCASIIEVIDGKFTIIKIAVKDEESAFWLFETLNDRGLDLSTADLLKNYLLRQAGTDRRNVRKNWELLVRNLGNLGVTGFVRVWWLSNVDVVREKDLYRKIISRYKSSADVESFSRQLLDSSEIFNALHDEDNDYWSKFEDDVRRKLTRRIEELSIFNLTQGFPVLMAALEVLPPDEIHEVFKMVAVFAIRHSIVSPGRGTGSLESAYSAAALMIRKNPKVKWRDVFQSLRPLYPSDTEFEEACQRQEFRKKAVGRYILRRIHDVGKAGVVATRDTTKLTLEHVLPSSPNEAWQAQFGGEDAIDYVYRLGNLTLLEAGRNRGLGNRDFAAKQEIYKTSEIDITRELADIPVWDADAIEERSAKLAKKMVHIWRLEI